MGRHIQANSRACLLEYIPLVFLLIYDLVRTGDRDQILKACKTMRDLNLSMEFFREQIVSLQMTGAAKIQLQNLPVLAKKNFTRLYNKMNRNSFMPTLKKIKSSSRSNSDSKSSSDNDNAMQCSA